MLNNEVKNNILKDIENRLQNNRLLKDSLFRDSYMSIEGWGIDENSPKDFGVVRNDVCGCLEKANIKIEYYLDEYDIEGVRRDKEEESGGWPYLRISYTDEIDVEYELYFKIFENPSTNSDFRDLKDISTEDAKDLVNGVLKLLNHLLELETNLPIFMFIEHEKEEMTTLPCGNLCGYLIGNLHLWTKGGEN